MFKVLVSQSCLTLWDPMDCSLPSSSVHGILQARILEWVAVPFSRGSCQPRDWTQVSHFAGRFFTIWATREAQEYWGGLPLPSPNDSIDVGNLISCSSALFKSSLNIRKFTVHVLLKPGLENFEHYFASMWDECNFVVVWTFLALPFFGIGMKTDFLQFCGHCWVFQICWHIECNTFTASSLGFEIAQLELHHLHQLCL